ncbi:hypothetical protein C8R43DRAFT_984281 [Mycena crocata]|nr:hypothetical protein C8R43DRAFT_984281 [Mycena crocata]
MFKKGCSFSSSTFLAMLNLSSWLANRIHGQKSLAEKIKAGKLPDLVSVAHSRDIASRTYQKGVEITLADSPLSACRLLLRWGQRYLACNERLGQ